MGLLPSQRITCHKHLQAPNCTCSILKTIIVYELFNHTVGKSTRCILPTPSYLDHVVLPQEEMLVFQDQIANEVCACGFEDGKRKMSKPAVVRVLNLSGARVMGHEFHWSQLVLDSCLHCTCGHCFLQQRQCCKSE